MIHNVGANIKTLVLSNLGFLCALNFVFVSGTPNNPEIPCGSSLIQPLGVLYSPGYPASYKRNQNCTWYFPVSAGSAIRFEFVSFQTQNSEECDHDSVQFLQAADDKIIATYCGSEVPDPLIQRKSVKVRFVSGPATFNEMFSILYKRYKTGTEYHEESHVDEEFEEKEDDEDEEEATSGSLEEEDELELYDYQKEAENVEILLNGEKNATLPKVPENVPPPTVWIIDLVIDHRGATNTSPDICGRITIPLILVALVSLKLLVQ